MSDSDEIDYQALAQQMLGQWQQESANYFKNPHFLKAMAEAMAPFQKAATQADGHPALAMMQQMQQVYSTHGDHHGSESPTHSAADVAVDADELAWVKQRLAACEARIAMLEAKVD